ncbi:hypothetical protein [Bacillus pseudomycoides]|uniref:hypothetical protein n=1 Tax=Bacillus pseudomycoides TaxID=64104 RepID=UPI000BFA9C73|nr:hypothetical protein [Bacillus pseudomycoides]PFW97436.1 hypothetical protein COL29_03840 [Bacillus pseudomycoides]
MNAGIEELEKSLSVEQRRLSEYKRELGRLEEKKPIVIENIQETESKVFEIEDAIAVLKKFIRGDDEE